MPSLISHFLSSFISAHRIESNRTHLNHLSALWTFGASCRCADINHNLSLSPLLLRSLAWCLHYSSSSSDSRSPLCQQDLFSLSLSSSSLNSRSTTFSNDARRNEHVCDYPCCYSFQVPADGTALLLVVFFFDNDSPCL